MKVLILYTTKYGSVKNSSEKLKEKLNFATEIINLRTQPLPALENFQIIILGASIYAGKPQKQMTSFLQKNLDRLLDKPVGLFLNCAEKGAEKYNFLNRAYTPQLCEHAFVKGFFGSEANLEKCSLIDKLLLKIIGGVKQSYSNLDDSAIIDFAETVNKFAD